MRSRSTWFLWPLLFLPLAGAVALYLYPKVLTGDFAEIEIDSVTAPAPGELRILYHGRLSYRTEFSADILASYAVQGFAGRPRRLEGLELQIYTIRNERGELASPSEVLARIRVKTGQSYRIRPDRPLVIFRYTNFEGDPVELSFSVCTKDPVVPQ